MTPAALWRLLEFAGDGPGDELPAELQQWLAEGDDAPSVSDAAFLASRTVIHLRNVALDDARCVERLYAHAPRLEQLMLDESPLSAEAFERLIDVPESHPLNRLAVWWEETPIDWRALSRARLGQQLSSLACSASDDGIADVLQLPKLVTLAIEVDFGTGAAAILRARDQGQQLRGLVLSGTCVRNQSTELLGALVAWSLPALEVLELSVSLERGWPELLGQAAILSNVVELRLSRTKIGTDGLEALASRALPHLRALSLWRVTDRGVATLQRSPWIGNLSALTVTQNRASAAAWGRLRASVPGLDLCGTK